MFQHVILFLRRRRDHMTSVCSWTYVITLLVARDTSCLDEPLLETLGNKKRSRDQLAYAKLIPTPLRCKYYMGYHFP